MTKIPTIVHNGTTVTSDNTWDNIQDPVVGHGTYMVGAGATLSFLYGVSPGQTIELSNQHADGAWGASHLNLVDWADFHGRVDLRYTPPPANAPAMEQSVIGLAMLTQAVDSYGYKNDLLKLWFNNKVVDRLSLTVHDPYGFTVQAQSTGAFVAISANTATVHAIEQVHGHPPAMALHNT